MGQSQTNKAYQHAVVLRGVVNTSHDMIEGDMRHELTKAGSDNQLSMLELETRLTEESRREIRDLEERHKTLVTAVENGYAMEIKTIEDSHKEMIEQMRIATRNRSKNLKIAT